MCLLMQKLKITNRHFNDQLHHGHGVCTTYNFRQLCVCVSATDSSQRHFNHWLHHSYMICNMRIQAWFLVGCGCRNKPHQVQQDKNTIPTLQPPQKMANSQPIGQPTSVPLVVDSALWQPLIHFCVWEDLLKKRCQLYLFLKCQTRYKIFQCEFSQFK